MSTKRITTKQLSGLSINAKCADCLHLSGVAHIDLKKPCKDLGVKEYSKACEHYNPNVLRMSRSLGAMESVLDIITNMSESDIRILTLAAMAAPSIAKHSPFKFGEKVFFNLSAPFADFIDSYYSGVVVGYAQRTSDDPRDHKGYVVLAGSLSSNSGTSLTLPVDMVLSEKHWAKVYRTLLSHGRFYTPDSKRVRFECSPPKQSIDYDVPTIDSGVDHLESLANNQKRGRGNKKVSPHIQTLRTEDYDDDLDEMETKSNPIALKQTKTKAGISVLTFGSTGSTGFDDPEDEDEDLDDEDGLTESDDLED
jgi:hypothetical protein